MTDELPKTVTLEAMLAKIQSTQYARLPNSTVTLAVLYLKNGHVVVGKSACVDPEMFNAELGEKIAFDDAMNQLWPLEGYMLSEDRYRAAQPRIQVQ